MKLFSKEVNFHRVPVVDTEGAVLGLLTQSRLIEYLANDLKDDLKDVFSKKMKEFKGELSTECYSVSPEDKALDAFGVMSHSKVTGVVVLNENKVEGVISVDDLKRTTVSKDLFANMYLPIPVFLTLSSEDPSLSHSTEPITISGETTLGEAVDLLNENKIHRIVLVDEDMSETPMILSLCDIISLVLDELK